MSRLNIDTSSYSIACPSLRLSFDPSAGEVDLFPQEITRVLLNLISNYAATKRKAETDGADYKPTPATATKNLGDRVEIRIRDNGTGIPPERYSSNSPKSAASGTRRAIKNPMILTPRKDCFSAADAARKCAPVVSTSSKRPITCGLGWQSA
jgi:hypothetical protein